MKDSVWSSFLKNGLQYVAEKKHHFIWELKNETKTIGKYTCYKATTNFRGRNYTAWYAPDIPLPYGPWKLQGLPGLILEAYDNTEEIYYYFKSIEYPTANKTAVSFIKSDNGKPIKWLDMKGYLQFCEEYLQKMYEKMLIADKESPNSGYSEKATIDQTFKEIAL
ncbi:hypothetical protein D3C86_1656270 [compost metagenome]